MKDFRIPDYYINRELSWIAFNERVLMEAKSESNPLFERLKFIAIASSNFDEFFMVRVAGLKDQVKAGLTKPDNKSGMTPLEQLHAVWERTHEVMQNMFAILREDITPELQKAGIRFLKAKQLDEEQEGFVHSFFHHQLYPVLTPMAVDASHPFPMLLNKSLNLAVLLEDDDVDSEGPLFAVVQVPSVVPRFLELPSPVGEAHFILLEDVISVHMDSLFRGYNILETCPFRITRNADLTIDEDETEDLLEAIEQELRKRKMGEPSRLAVDASMSEFLQATLLDWLELDEPEIYRFDGPLDPTFFFRFHALEGYDHLRFEPLTPQQPLDFFGDGDIFSAIERRDLLLHHPYESFDPVIRFVQEAAEDPKVLAIKQTLYRVSGDSPIVNALLKAADNGKQVMVLLELKARFDEENNIVWAKKLENAGCHVIYGLAGLKTHSKITLVVRAEENGLRRYVHLSTGNYNDKTAGTYTDIGMFTAHEDFGTDATHFFNHLSGYSYPPEWKVISTAPTGLRDTFLSLIQREIENSLAGKPAYIIAKMNSLTDKEIMMALYEASCAGVKIDLIVRGICCLRPGIQGVSENIRVISIVGRNLEHSRIFHFCNGGDPQIYLSSADWMTRNMMARVEILFPVLQRDLRRRIKALLETMLQDDTKAHQLMPDGTYVRVQPKSAFPMNSQLFFWEETFMHNQKRELELAVPRMKPITSLLQ
ncbi:RNA degradosome polyphosphate kinase [Brevibacillus centrosporus]|uniref:RNA degradosome polyphosphate kinase n=1 Tax=Brevibacillus centrosporus TaxID=54910 RepID=UPI000F0A13C5|nr:RNA degradosome polyphosphate kinase [Brevibacillus centrosporus]MEC2130102.1 RNA degradosome polyphosphate kinase [Brevibacillus centrosporus]RNB65280.1 RNA degradosome polyphosphate kinase [Brevibacillus centrosporus]GED33716.1 polyphosphate kinase [Brevibacillus centrosporus]